jgi:hypothetical protein
VEVTEVEPGPGQEAVEEARPVLHPPEPGLHQRGQLADVVLGEVGQRPFQVRPDRLHRIQLAGIRRQPVDPQPGPGGDQFPHRAADVGVQAPTTFYGGDSHGYTDYPTL